MGHSYKKEAHQCNQIIQIFIVNLVCLHHISLNHLYSSSFTENWEISLPGSLCVCFEISVYHYWWSMFHGGLINKFKLIYYPQYKEISSLTWGNCKTQSKIRWISSWLEVIGEVLSENISSYFWSKKWTEVVCGPDPTLVPVLVVCGLDPTLVLEFFLPSPYNRTKNK